MNETEAEVKVQKKSLHLFGERRRASTTPVSVESVEIEVARRMRHATETRNARRYFRLIFGCISISLPQSEKKRGKTAGVGFNFLFF